MDMTVAEDVLGMPQALPHWPNVLSVGQRAAQHKSPASGSTTGQVASHAQGGQFRLHKLKAAMQRRAAGPQVLLTEHTQALWHNYKPLVRFDKAVTER